MPQPEPERRIQAVVFDMDGLMLAVSAVSGATMVAMPGSNDRTKRRASARGKWPVRKYRLGSEPSDDLRDATTAEQRLQMMWQLTVDAWAMSGKRLPDYDRGAASVRKFLRKIS